MGGATNRSLLTAYHGWEMGDMYATPQAPPHIPSENATRTWALGVRVDSHDGPATLLVAAQQP